MGFFSYQSRMNHCAGTGATKDRYLLEGRRALCNGRVAVPGGIQ
jgi:hypothetical protein